MSKVYTFNAYICESNPPYANVVDLGVYYSFLCGATGIATGDYAAVDSSFLSDKIDDYSAFGGSIISSPDGSHVRYLETLFTYVPNLVNIEINGDYLTASYKLKLISTIDSNYQLLSNGVLSVIPSYFNFSTDGGQNFSTEEIRFSALNDYLNLSRFYGNLIATFDKDGNVANPAYEIIVSGTLDFGNWNYSISSKTLNSKELDFLNSLPSGAPPAPSTDPYNPGGDSSTGGGTGNFDGTGDNINIPSVPTLSSVDTGFITLFNPTMAQLKELASYMWNGTLFDLNTWQKLFADPMDAILGLSIVPVAIPNGGAGEVKVGNISTGVSMTKAASQYVVVDCGTLNVNEYWGGYLDYEPYTKAEIYLPYCGIHQIATDDIMGKAVHVVYHVDILSGACCAYVKCDDSVLYSFIGQCASSIPISGTDFTNVINGVISAAVSVGSMVATGGTSAPLAVPSLAQTAVNSMKPSIEKSGAMGGTGGMLAVQTPYLILTRPRQAVPARQNTFTGYPSFITEKLGDLSGYTEIEEIHLENISATESELSEIENLLKSGVIF